MRSSRWRSRPASSWTIPSGWPAFRHVVGLAQLLPEREPHRRVYDALRSCSTPIDQDDVWPALLVRWELGLLDELGFGLDLIPMRRNRSGGEPCLCVAQDRQAVSRGGGRPLTATGSSALPAFLSAARRRSLPDVHRRFPADRLLPRPPCLRAARPLHARSSPDMDHPVSGRKTALRTGCKRH